MTRVNFLIGDATVPAELSETDTARRIIAALPIESAGSYWGGEFYFSAPIQSEEDETAREVVEPGTVAFWVDGSCLCLFWGPTPVSKGGECRAASAVNVVGRVTKPELLPALKGRKVRVELASA
jgi:hypothetical protein